MPIQILADLPAGFVEIAAAHFPQANEDELLRAADEHDRDAEHLDNLASRLQEEAGRIADHSDGEMIAALEAQLCTQAQQLRDVAAARRSLAHDCRAAADYTIENKILVNLTLAQLAVEVAAAVAFIMFAPAAIARVTAAEAAAQTTCRWAWRKLVARVVTRCMIGSAERRSALAWLGAGGWGAVQGGGTAWLAQKLTEAKTGDDVVDSRRILAATVAGGVGGVVGYGIFIGTAPGLHRLDVAVRQSDSIGVRRAINVVGLLGVAALAGGAGGVSGTMAAAMIDRSGFTWSNIVAAADAGLATGLIGSAVHAVRRQVGDTSSLTAAGPAMPDKPRYPVRGDEIRALLDVGAHDTLTAPHRSLLAQDLPFGGRPRRSLQEIHSDRRGPAAQAVSASTESELHAVGRLPTNGEDGRARAAVSGDYGSFRVSTSRHTSLDTAHIEPAGESPASGNDLARMDFDDHAIAAHDARSGRPLSHRSLRVVGENLHLTPDGHNVGGGAVPSSSGHDSAADSSTYRPLETSRGTPETTATTVGAQSTSGTEPTYTPWNQHIRTSESLAATHVQQIDRPGSHRDRESTTGTMARSQTIVGPTVATPHLGAGETEPPPEAVNSQTVTDSPERSHPHRADMARSSAQYTPVPDDEVIDPTDPAFDHTFVVWDRPTLHPSNPADRSARQPIEVHPLISAPHRDRLNVPDGNTQSSALRPIENPERVPVPLRDLGDLAPWTAYPVLNANNTSTTFITDDTSTVRWVEATVGNKNMALPGKGKWSGFNPDLSFPLLPDTLYRVANFHTAEKFLYFHTDRHGQTDAMSGDIEPGGQNPSFRDDDGKKGAQQRACQEGEAAYPNNDPDRQPNQGNEAKTRWKWAGGHLMANEFGGPGESVNMYPQMAASNSGNDRDGWTHAASWRAKEIALAAFAAVPNQEVRNYQVSMIRDSDGVPAEVLMRWQEVTYRLGPDGSVQIDPLGTPVVESIVTKQRRFPNKGATYGPQIPYTNR